MSRLQRSPLIPLNRRGGIALTFMLSVCVSSAFAQPSQPRGEVISPTQFVRKQVGGGKAVIEIFTEEYLLIESGSGMLTIDGVKHHVKAGDLIYMPARAEVSFKNGPQPLIALQIFAGPESARKYDKWAPIKPKRAIR